MSNVKNVECNFKVKIIYKFIRRRLTGEEERRRKRLKHKINFNFISSITIPIKISMLTYT